MAEAVLSVHELRKRFGGVHALRGANLRVAAGEVHALVGENGSGKSTLLKIVSGQLRRDTGRVVLNGNEVEFRSPTEALRAGIATVTQETTLVPDLSIAENVFLGHRLARRGPMIDWRGTRAQAKEALDRLQLALDPARVVRRLRPDQQQMVEIARALSTDARVLILDEPTSSLTDDEVTALFRVVRRLKEQGVAVVFVSHRLQEVFDVADRYTVLRDGITVGSGTVADVERPTLIHLMVGRELEHYASEAAAAAHGESAEPVLRVRELSLAGHIDGVSFDVGAGEIVGLAGLVGAGRSELLESIFGLHRGVGGEIRLDGRTLRLRGPRDASALGIAFVPADRKRQGLVLHMSVRDNLAMAATARLTRLRRPTRTREHGLVASAIGRLRIRTPSPAAAVSTLSGGNQQKVVLGKWLATNPRVLMLDEPTRGVDVGAKAEIYRLLSNAAANGIAVVVSSSETPELLLICDRILVMFRGRIVASLSREEATEARIASFAAGHAR
jgi:ABC-type sugar transport system ATPase subunit